MITIPKQRQERIEELRRRIAQMRCVVYNRTYPVATPSEQAEIGCMELELLRLEEQREHWLRGLEFGRLVLEPGK